jgi:hypothetical protein
LLLCFRLRDLCSPANPSEEGGLEELVEFFFRPASCLSRSAICHVSFPQGCMKSARRSW